MTGTVRSITIQKLLSNKPNVKLLLFCADDADVIVLVLSKLKALRFVVRFGREIEKNGGKMTDGN